jgi:glutamate---cysteine ligase / carboxylate-amine ligase
VSIGFAASPRSTIGLEWEIMLADSTSGDLVPRAPELLGTLGHVEGITGELLTNTVEAVSAPHARVADAIDDLSRIVDQVRDEASPRGIRLLSAGSHPTARWFDQQITPKSRYDKLIERTQWWGRNMMIWGMHVHVGIDDPAKVIPIVAALTNYLPHLQALASSSPFWAGEETGYASNRALVFQQLPTAGLPWEVRDWNGFERYVADLQATGVVDDVTEVRWDVRPAPRWGTVEVRACDAVTNPAEFAAIAALTQSLVEWFSRRLDAGEDPGSLQPWFHRENKWRAARYGLDAAVIVGRDGEQRTVRAHLGELVEVLSPIAADLGCARELHAVHPILATGSSADRQRRVAHAGATGEPDLDAVVRHLFDEFDAGAALP